MGKGLGWAGLGWVTDLGTSKTLEQLQPGVPDNAALSPPSVFLVRESQRNPQGFVLSLCHLQKVKHYLILPVSNSLTPKVGFCSLGSHDLKPHDAPPFSLYKKRGLIAVPTGCSSARDSSLTCFLATPQSEDEGCLYFSMDEGQTRFTDLLQLVEFHQLNRGILPCLLRHCCARVAL